MDKDKFKITKTDKIKNLIYTIRGLQVMLDNDLADLYNVKTKYLNKAVKRNLNRFPEKFRFQITKEEYEYIKTQNKFLKFQNGTSGNNNLKFQNGTSNSKRGGRRYLPYVFTEQGVAMLASILKSETAVKISIQIIDAFVAIRKFIFENASIFQRLDYVEKKQLETDEKFNKIFDALESKENLPKQGIFFDGQIFDAYKFVSDLIKTANKSIIVIDNYIDYSVLISLAKRKKNVKVAIYTKKVSEQLALDLEKYNAQYPFIELKELKNAHDRFLIIDNKKVYHFGASLKDLGKKWFAFSKLEKDSFKIIEKLENL